MAPPSLVGLWFWWLLAALASCDDVITIDTAAASSHDASISSSPKPDAGNMDGVSTTIDASQYSTLPPPPSDKTTTDGKITGDAGEPPLVFLDPLPLPSDPDSEGGGGGLTELAFQACIVGLDVSLSHDLENSVQLMQRLSSAIVGDHREYPVKFGILSSGAILNPEWFTKNTGAEESPSSTSIHPGSKVRTGIYGFPRLKRDRSCLVAPSVPKRLGYVPFEPTIPESGSFSKFGSGRGDDKLEGGQDGEAAELFEFLDFINTVCHTYYALNGSFNDRGRKRQKILSGLYSVRSRSNAVSLGALADVCGWGNLPVFFKSGLCQSSSHSILSHNYPSESSHNNKNTCPRPKPSIPVGRFPVCFLGELEYESLSLTGYNDWSVSGHVDQNSETSFTNSISDGGGQNRTNESLSQKEDGLQKSTILSQQNTPKTPSLITLPTCDEISLSATTPLDFLRSHVFASRPVVVRGGASHWPARRTWTNDWLRGRYGNRSVHVKLTPHGEFEGVENRRLWVKAVNADSPVPRKVLESLVAKHLVMVRPAGVEMSMGEFLDLVEGRGTLDSKNVSAYLEYTSLGDVIDESAGDIEETLLSPWLNLLHTNIWLSDGNTLGKLHFDEFDNILVQLSGQKQVLLFEPASLSNGFYEGHLLEAELGYRSGRLTRQRLMQSVAMTMSPLDVTRPDFETFPRARNLSPLNCTIGPGDMLYLPAFWGHEVQSYPDLVQERNLAVNFWFEPFLTKEFPCQTCALDINPAYRHVLDLVL